MAEDYDMIKDDNAPGGGDSGMDELQFDDIDSMLASGEPDSVSTSGLEDLSIEADPLESLIASSGEEYPTSFENDFSFHPEESSSNESIGDESLDLELTDPLIDAEIDKLLDISEISKPNKSNLSHLESDDSFFIPADENETSDQDFSELDTYLTEEPDVISFGEELDDLDDFGLTDLDDEGPISLHEDDLQGVKPDFSLQDFHTEDEQQEELDHGDLSFDEDDFLNEEEGPISLSEDELGAIGATEAPLADFSHPDAGEEESIALSGSELDGILETDDKTDWGSPSLDTLGDLDEDGPISLSGNELDDILGSSSEPAAKRTVSADEDDELPDFITHHDEPETEDEGPIALSEDELGNLLADNSGEDTNEPLDSFPELNIGGEESASSMPDFTLDSEDEEPISLSLDELDTIQSDATTLDESETVDDGGFDLSPEESVPESEDNEPIALSEEELGNLLSDDSGSEELEGGDGFSDLLHDDTLPEDTGSMFGGDDSDSFTLPVEQDLGGPDEFGLEEEALPDHSDFAFEPGDSISEPAEDGEPIALSQEELGNLLSNDLEEEKTESLFDEPTSDEDDLISLPVSELDELGEVSETASVEDDGFAFDDFELPTNDLDAVLEAPSSSSLEDDEGPIALSDDELGNLLSTEGPETEDSSFDFEPNKPSLLDEDEDEGPIALSDDELGNLLSTEGPETENSSFDFEPNKPSLLDEDDDEGPIALSDEELGNLLSTEGPATEDSSFDFEPNKPSLLDEDDDEGPIALSDDELGNLLSTEGPETENSSFDFEPTEESVLDDGEPIALSSDELDHLLTGEAEAEEGEFPGADSEIDWDSPLSEPGEVPLEDEEPIALSTDELDHLLTDEAEAEEGEFPGADSEIDWDAPLSEPGEVPLEDEEPIALSTDELDHILTDDAAATSLEEDEGPIALSEDELGNLLSDVESPAEEGEDLNEILGELPASSDLDAFGSLDEDVPLAEPDSSSPIVPTAETVQDDGMIIVLDEYADEEELSPMEELRKTPDQTVVQPSSAEAGEVTPSKEEMKRIMTYLDELLGNLPDDLIREFSQSDYFELYKKLMKQIGV
ncbi:hypothetical protein JWG44_10855 [Leptospira sp. 201903071]|uniref:hypothetical protein n=1 Tax=Leptospira ainazelensis TaxID=2810034 RepID=UPI00196541F3|nr:hypothetical protein [Leptospira ainazelensis]MBM9500745.1 hypothetical protein [Leptospira ainazelensis]